MEQFKNARGRRIALPTVAERVEQAILRSNGRLRLWLVFDEPGDLTEARALLAGRKLRHLEAMSREEWERREAAALHHAEERIGATVSAIGRMAGNGDAAASHAVENGRKTARRKPGALRQRASA